MLPNEGSASRVLQAMRLLEAALAVLAAWFAGTSGVAAAELIVRQQPLWLLPGLYLVELFVLTCAGAFGIVFADVPRVGGTWLGWLAVGALSAVVVLGAMSIGFLYIPSVLLLALAAVLCDARRRTPIAKHFLIAFGAALAQGALMLAVVLMQ